MPVLLTAVPLPGLSGGFRQGIGLEVMVPHGFLLSLPNRQILLHLHLTHMYYAGQVIA